MGGAAAPSSLARPKQPHYDHVTLLDTPMRLVFALLIVLPACTQLPALDGTIAPAQADAPFPDLVPLAPLIAQVNSNTATATTTAADVAPRIATLSARAARLRGPLIPAPVRTRMLRGVR
jgi:hypothetical protein